MFLRRVSNRPVETAYDTAAVGFRVSPSSNNGSQRMTREFKACPIRAVILKSSEVGTGTLKGRGAWLTRLGLGGKSGNEHEVRETLCFRYALRYLGYELLLNEAGVQVEHRNYDSYPSKQRPCFVSFMIISQATMSPPHLRVHIERDEITQTL